MPISSHRDQLKQQLTTFGAWFGRKKPAALSCSLKHSTSLRCSAKGNSINYLVTSTITRRKGLYPYIIFNNKRLFPISILFHSFPLQTFTSFLKLIHLFRPYIYMRPVYIYIMYNFELMYWIETRNIDWSPKWKVRQGAKSDNTLGVLGGGKEKIAS